MEQTQTKPKQIKADYPIFNAREIRCVMCGKTAVIKVYETDEPLCEKCYNINMEARHSK